VLQGAAVPGIAAAAGKKLLLAAGNSCENTTHSQSTATHFSTLHHSAAHCHTLQQTAFGRIGSHLKHTAAHCNTLQHTTTTLFALHLDE